MPREAETNNNKQRGAKISSGAKLISAGIVLLIAVALTFQFADKLKPDNSPVPVPQQTDHTPNSSSTSSALPIGTGPLIEIDTAVGKIHIELYPSQAPVAVAQLIKLTKSGYYNSDVLLQSQAQLGFAIAKLGSSIKKFDYKDELNNLTSRRGSVAIAKLSASPAYLNTLFFGYSSQPDLEKHYTIIGQVVDGIELIEKSLSGQRLKVNSFKLIDRPSYGLVDRQTLQPHG